MLWLDDWSVWPGFLINKIDLVLLICPDHKTWHQHSAITLVKQCRKSLPHLSLLNALLHPESTKCDWKAWKYLPERDMGLCFQCRWQLVLWAAGSSCAVLIKLSSPLPPSAMSCVFVLHRVDMVLRRTFHNCHQLSVIQLLLCGTNSLLQLFHSQEKIQNKCLWIKCVLISEGWQHHFQLLFCRHSRLNVSASLRAHCLFSLLYENETKTLFKKERNLSRY